METLWTSSDLEWQDFIWTVLSACSARTHLVSIVCLQRKTCERKTWRSELSAVHRFPSNLQGAGVVPVEGNFEREVPRSSAMYIRGRMWRAFRLSDGKFRPKFTGIYLRSSNFSFNNLIRRTFYFFFFEIDFALTESFIQFLVNYPSGGNANRYLGRRIGVVWVGLLAFCQESLLGGRSKCINCKNLEVLVHWSMEIGDLDCKFRWTLIASWATVICSMYLHCTVRMLARFGVYF